MSRDTQQFSTIPFRREDLQALLKQRQSEILVRFVHFSDTHLNADPDYTHAEADYTPLQGARELVRQINALPFKPDFVLHGGDVAYDPDESAYHTAREILSEIQFPIHYLVGNHDDRAALQKIAVGRSDILPKYYYEFDVNGVQFVMLDSNAPAPFAGGALGGAQLDWLRGICETVDPRPLVVGVHHNALPIGAPFWDEFMRMTDGEDFHQILLAAQKRLRGVFFGHVHQATDTYRDGILYSSVPSTWYQLHCYPGQSGILPDIDAEPGFNVVTLTRSQTFIRRHRFHVPEHHVKTAISAKDVASSSL
jgi:3',5'-cyclic AMP phosphodiesterase CpdA